MQGAYFGNCSADGRADRHVSDLFLHLFHTNFRYLVVMIKVAVAQRTSGVAGEEHLIGDWIVDWGFVRESKRVV